MLGGTGTSAGWRLTPNVTIGEQLGFYPLCNHFRARIEWVVPVAMDDGIVLRAEVCWPDHAGRHRSGGKRQIRIQARAGAGRAMDGDRAAERLDPVFQPH